MVKWENWEKAEGETQESGNRIKRNGARVQGRKARAGWILKAASHAGEKCRELVNRKERRDRKK